MRGLSEAHPLSRERGTLARRLVVAPTSFQDGVRKGLEVTTQTGDLQAEKEIEMFLHRLKAGR